MATGIKSKDHIHAVGVLVIYMHEEHAAAALSSRCSGILLSCASSTAG
jgi:hypothetical protein